MEYVLIAICLLVIGFVAGALVYRKYMKEFEKAKNDAEALVQKLEQEIRDLSAKVRK